ncbi:MAG TPA: hypothetical protein VH595_12215 [Verrucomicrobiae bacterium]|jgi:hypothetical protein|nr:hypothetical protein [Verrucomicrobiae bacterium]
MTSQPPAPKASSAAALLATLPTNPPKAAEPVSADFLSVILQALSPKTKTEGESGTSKEPGAQKDKTTATTISTGTDATDSSGLLLTLLAMSAPPLAPLPKLPKFAARKAEAEPVKGFQAPAAGLNTKEDVAAKDSKADSLAKTLTPVDPKAKPEISPETVSGTSAATNGQRMSFAAQKNEVAGAAEQKLPLTSATSVAGVTAVEAPAAPGQDGSKKSLDLSWRETPPEMVAMVNLAAKPAETAVAEAATISTAASPADRLEKMISQEVVTIRQTGAQTLGVSLKVDDNTQLFLQLTTQNGQIQASLRCEKGNFSALDSQWSQLQESLARQNVQLMPAAGASSFNFQQSSQQQQQQRNLPQQWEEWRQANPGVPPAQSRQQKNPNTRRSRNDWESWA